MRPCFTQISRDRSQMVLHLQTRMETIAFRICPRKLMPNITCSRARTETQPLRGCESFTTASYNLARRGKYHPAQRGDFRMDSFTGKIASMVLAWPKDRSAEILCSVGTPVVCCREPRSTVPLKANPSRTYSCDHRHFCQDKRWGDSCD